MNFLLNGVAIKEPVTMQRNPIQISKSHVVLTGVSKRDYVRQKETFILPIQMLSQTQVQDINTIYALMRPVTFVVSELGINTTVWVDIQNREYSARGTDYRENLTLVLEEV